MRHFTHCRCLLAQTKHDRWFERKGNILNVLNKQQIQQIISKNKWELVFQLQAKISSIEYGKKYIQF